MVLQNNKHKRTLQQRQNKKNEIKKKRWPRQARNRMLEIFSFSRLRDRNPPTLLDFTYSSWRRGSVATCSKRCLSSKRRKAQKHLFFSFFLLPPSLPMQHYALHQPLLPFLSKMLLHDQTDISPVIKYNLKFLSKKKNYTKNDRARWSQESHLEISILFLRITIVNRKIRENKRCPDSIRPISNPRTPCLLLHSSFEWRGTVDSSTVRGCNSALYSALRETTVTKDVYLV